MNDAELFNGSRAIAENTNCVAEPTLQIEYNLIIYEFHKQPVNL